MTKTPKTPDLLTPVVAALKALTPKELDAAAVSVGASSMTLKNVRDEKSGTFGPSYALIAKLHVLLVEKSKAPAH